MNVRAEPPSEAAASWPEEIFSILQRFYVRQVPYVPDAGHTQLIKACEADNAISAVSLTSEEEGVAMLAGAWLGGQRGALLMQSSGVGNCINTLSIIQECRFPLLMVVTMRGAGTTPFGGVGLTRNSAIRKIAAPCRMPKKKKVCS